jgi:hypothetical protein
MIIAISSRFRRTALAALFVVLRQNETVALRMESSSSIVDCPPINECTPQLKNETLLRSTPNTVHLRARRDFYPTIEAVLSASRHGSSMIQLSAVAGYDI